MSIEVIGAGFGRTGTFSLKLALEQLGVGPCFHMFELAQHRATIGHWESALKGREPDWEKVFHGYRSTVDFPACLYYRELMKEYPKAKVILTHRDPASWYESAYKTILTIRPSAAQVLKVLSFLSFSEDARNTLRFALHNKKLIEDRLFSGRVNDRNHVIDVYKRHIDEVKATVPGERLLIYQVSEGWEPLCNFLRLPIPEEPFPRSNHEGDFTRLTRNLFFSF